MRMIDRFRTPSQQKIIRWLEANHIGTRFDIIKAIGMNTRSYRHFQALVKDEVIHICGYAGCKNQQVYALVRREVGSQSKDCSHAQGGVLEQ